MLASLRVTSRLMVLAFVGGALIAIAAAPALAGLGAKEGRYRGQYRDVDDPGDRGRVMLKVADGGRVIRSFEASPLAVCINPDAIGGIEVVSRDFLIGKVRVKSDGRFHKRRTVRLRGDSRQVFELTGRLRKGRVHGRILMERHCSSTERFSARRRP